MSSSIPSPPEDKPRRKFPPPCWTHDEAVALIEVYRDKWYSLRRGYLRTPDWDDVASQVSARCPGATPAKTSAQCRHKMEKLRQKYRTEKQRSLSFPGRFFSSWVFFDYMDSMEIGPSPANQQVKLPLVDANFAAVAFKSKKFKSIDRDSNPNLALDPNPSGRIGLNVVNLGFRSNPNPNPNPNFGSRALNGGGYSYQLDDGSDQDADSDVGFGGEFRNPNTGNFQTPPGFRVKNTKPSFDSDHEADNGVEVGIGIGSRPKKIGRFDNGGGDHCGYNNGKSANGKTPIGGFDPRVMNNGFSNSSSRSGSGKKKGGLMEELVSSIKLLGEGFVKVEKMKMEMTKEIEQMRMEMEMKRSKMILESQQQIVDAFVKVLMEKKKNQKIIVKEET